MKCTSAGSRSLGCGAQFLAMRERLPRQKPATKSGKETRGLKIAKPVSVFLSRATKGKQPQPVGSTFEANHSFEVF